MGSDFHEKDYDDEVYEDGYYEEHYDEEELEDEADLLDEEGVEDPIAEEEDDDDEEEEDDAIEAEEIEEVGWDADDTKKITVSYACEECDYRWDDIVIKKKNPLEEEEIDVICPMCGSMNVTLI